MHITHHTLGTISRSGFTSSQHTDGSVSGIYSEQTQHRTKPSPTPSWRKPDPSQWRYPSQK